MSNVSKIPLENAYSTNLTNSISAAATTITVDTAPRFTLPVGQTFYIVVDPKNSFREVMEVTAISGNDLTVTRGANDYSGGASTATTHSGGAVVVITNNYQVFNEYGAAINTKLDQDGGNTTTTFDLQVSGSNHRIRKDGGDWKFTDDNQAEVSLSTLAAAAGVDDKFKVSSNDTTSGYLNGKAVAGDGIDFTENNDGGNETLTIATDVTDIISGDFGLEESSNDLRVKLATDPGLEFSTGVRVKVKADGGITRDADGLSLTNAETIDATFAEAIDGTTTPKAVFISRGTSGSDATVVQSQITENDTDVDIYGVNFGAQTFTMSTYEDTITRIDLMLMEVSNPSGNFQIDLYAVDGSGKPTGSSLGSKTTVATNVGTSLVWISFTFSSAITVTPGTQYAIVAKCISGDSSNYVEWQTGNGDTYSGGQAWTSADAGGTWSSASNDFAFRVWSYEAQTAGEVYMSNKSEPFRGGFDGFVNTSVAAAATGTVRVNAKQSGFTGLTPGVEYYVGSTDGGIITSSGGLKVGKTMASTTDILIDKSDSFIRGDQKTSPTTISKSATAISSYYLFWNIGFKPSKIHLYVWLSCQTGAASNVREYAFNGTYVTALDGTAIKTGGSSAAFYAQSTFISEDTSLSVTDGGSAQTITVGTIARTSAGLSLAVSVDAAGAASYDIIPVFYR